MDYAAYYSLANTYHDAQFHLPQQSTNYRTPPNLKGMQSKSFYSQSEICIIRNIEVSNNLTYQFKPLPTVIPAVIIETYHSLVCRSKLSRGETTLLDILKKKRYPPHRLKEGSFGRPSQIFHISWGPPNVRVEVKLHISN